MEERGFQVATSLDGGRAVIAVRGEIDMATVDRLSDALAAATRDGADEVWIDLTDVGFMDSTGLSALVTGHRALDGRLAVICPDGAARRALDVSGLDEVIRVYQTTPDVG